jgi:predicted nucleic acid-binding Zn ribbon protein
MTSGRSRPREHISNSLSELIALRGIARVQGHARLVAAWQAVAGPQVAAGTRILGIRRGVLQVAVANAPLMGELAAFRKVSLLEDLSQDFADLKIRDLKFVLKGDLPAS